MTHSLTTLIVERDHRQASFLSTVLRELGPVDQLDSAEDALLALEASCYDLAIIDLSLPGADGLAVVRALKRSGARTAILVLAAPATEAERARAFEAGADDLITKPFGVADLRARARRLLGARAERPAPVLFGSIAVDPQRRCAATDGKAISLTRLEFDLLWNLVRRRGAVATRVDLLDEVWGLNINPGSNVIDRHLSILRKKLGPGASAQIETVRGIGYRLHSPPSGADEARASSSASMSLR